MTMYCVGFDVSALSLGTLTVATTGGPNAADITISAVTATTLGGDSGGTHFFPVSGTSSFTITGESKVASAKLNHFSATGWFTALRDAVRTRMTAVGGGWTTSSFTITFSESTGVVTVAYTQAFTLTWSATAGRAICGFSANQSGSSSYAGTVVPTYCILSTLDATSDSTPNYEPNNIGTHMITDNGQGHGVSRYDTPLYRDWIQQFETKAKTIRLSAASTHPFTYQELFEHCRGRFPFVVSSGFGESYREAFSLRTEGIPWNPQRASPGNDAQFHIPFRAVVEGQLP